MITKLSPEQEALIPTYAGKWLANGHKTTRVNQEKATTAVDWLYTEILKVKTPEIVFVKGPAEACEYLGVDMAELRAGVWLCNWWVGWIAFFDYLLNEVFPERKAEFPNFVALTEHWTNLHAIVPYDTVCVVLDYPTELVVDAENRLHNETGPAISYGDGRKSYCLTGRKVPDWIVETKPSAWTKEQILSEPNAEVRREIIRRLGAMEAVKRLGAKLIDSKDYSDREHFLTHEGRCYELMEVDFGTGGTRRYLKMSNASVADIHIEAVDPRCSTVDMALGYRERAIEGDKWLTQGYTYKAPAVLY